LKESGKAEFRFPADAYVLHDKCPLSTAALRDRIRQTIYRFLWLQPI